MSASLRRSRPAAAAIAAALLLTACGTGDGTTEPASAAQEDAGTDIDTATDPDGSAEADAGGHDMDEVDAAAVDVTAEELRATLNRLLQEHVYLAGLATGEALAGNEAGFEAAAGQLTRGNTADLADLVGAVYGADVREQFFGFWNSHIEMFVDYTVATAEGDEAAQEDAVERLIGYSQELADTFETLTDGALPASATQPAIQEHVVTLKEAVDAQAAGDAEAAFANLRAAAHHMDGMAEALAGAIATQHGLEGDASSDLAGVRSELNALLQEHVYLAGAFTGTALAGEDATAAQNALIGGNTEDLADLVAAVYGDRADRDEFVQFWNSHILMFAAYTEGVATDDGSAQQAAVEDLLSYSEDLAVAFEQLTAGELPASASQPLIQEHITSLAPAVDAQGAGDPATAYAELRNAAAHMEMIAFPLFDATVASL
jgi:hypothetical protein